MRIPVCQQPTDYACLPAEVLEYLLAFSRVVGSEYVAVLYIGFIDRSPELGEVRDAFVIGFCFVEA
jgi:hypothetical protein